MILRVGRIQKHRSQVWLIRYLSLFILSRFQNLRDLWTSLFDIVLPNYNMSIPNWFSSWRLMTIENGELLLIFEYWEHLSSSSRLMNVVVEMVNCFSFVIIEGIYTRPEGWLLVFWKWWTDVHFWRLRASTTIGIKFLTTVKAHGGQLMLQLYIPYYSGSYYFHFLWSEGCAHGACPHLTETGKCHSKTLSAY